MVRKESFCSAKRKARRLREKPDREAARAEYSRSDEEKDGKKKLIKTCT